MQFSTCKSEIWINSLNMLYGLNPTSVNSFAQKIRKLHSKYKEKSEKSLIKFQLTPCKFFVAHAKMKVKSVFAFPSSSFGLFRVVWNEHSAKKLSVAMKLGPDGHQGFRSTREQKQASFGESQNLRTHLTPSLARFGLPVILRVWFQLPSATAAMLPSAAGERRSIGKVLFRPHLDLAAFFYLTVALMNVFGP